MYIAKSKLFLLIKTKKPNSGFTLIEILIVFTIMSLLTGLGFAGFVSYTNKQALDQAAFDIKAGVEQTKQLAVNRVKPTGFSGPLDRYRIIFCNPAAAAGSGCLIDQANNLYEIDALNDTGSIVNVVAKKRPSTVTMVTSGTCTDRLRFYILKASDATDTCTIKLSSTQFSGVSKTICVDTGGSATIYNSDRTCP